MTGVMEILKHIGYTNFTDYGRQLSTTPLYRKSDNKTALTINKETGEFYDFVEGIGGSLELLIEKTIGGPITEEIKSKIASGILESPKENPEIEFDHVKTFDKNLLFKLKKDHAYWIKRGISEMTINKFEGGVATTGRMAGRYVFPIFNDRNDLVGFSGRLLYVSNQAPKWKHLGAKLTWCYPHKQNGNCILNTRTAILVESIGDMISLAEAGINNVLVTFGIKVSPKIIESLLKFDCDRIFISFNNDFEKNMVGNRAAFEARKTLLNYFDLNQIFVSLPEEKNDFGEMSLLEIDLWKSKNQI